MQEAQTKGRYIVSRSTTGRSTTVERRRWASSRNWRIITKKYKSAMGFFQKTEGRNIKICI